MQVAVSALSSNFGLIGFTVLDIEQFSYVGILVWNCLLTPILGGFGGILSPNDVIYRRDPQRALPCAETRRLSHKAWKSVQRFDLGAGSRKKGQDRTGQDCQKVTKALYFTYLGRSPHWTDFHKNLHGSCRSRCNHVCKLLSWNFQGLRFYRGSFSYWFFHGSYNSAALLRCLWCPGRPTSTQSRRVWASDTTIIDHSTGWLTIRRTQLVTVRITWVDIARSESTQMPRSCTDRTGVTVSDHTKSGSSGIWCCPRAHVHHRTLDLSALLCNRFDR